MATRVCSALSHATGSSAATEIGEQLSAGLASNAPALVVVFASTAQPLGELVENLSRRFPTAKIIGSSTAGEFTERGDAKQSVAAFALAGDYVIHTGIATGLRESPDAAVKRALEGMPRSVHGFDHRTAIVLLDPLAGNGEEVTLMVADALGIDQPIAGGAAGDDLKMKSTTVACGAAASADAITIAQIFSKRPLGIGVCHGHRALSTPLRVTRARGATVEEIEGRPAWDVWREHTKAAAKAHGIDVDALAADAEGAYLLQYEAALAAGDGFKVRAPLSRTGGAINFACGIPEGSVIRITESDAGAQISSAREAARRARQALGGDSPAGALVFDCICRNLILGPQFADAVAGMVDELGGAPLAGFETYGEIAMDVGDMSGFHNTTSVVLAFPK
jgi:methyl-accepting chemotaxis protein